MSATILWMIAWLARGPVSASVPPIRTGGPDGAAPESALDSTSTPKPPTRETTALRLTMPFLFSCEKRPACGPPRGLRRAVYSAAVGASRTKARDKAPKGLQNAEQVLGAEARGAGHRKPRTTAGGRGAAMGGPPRPA